MPRPGSKVAALSTNATVYLGIDPGLSGGIVAIQGPKVRQYRMPSYPLNILDVLTTELFEAPIVHAVLEQVPHSIFGGAKSSSSKLYGSFKALEMALTAIGIPYTLIPAKKWQTTIGIKKNKGESDAHWKGRLRQKARILFPLRPIHKDTADALLLAECCRRLHEEK